MRRIREAEQEDFQFYYELKCEPFSQYWSGFDSPPEKESLHQYFTKLINYENVNRKMYIILDDNIQVGYLQLTKNNENEMEIGYGVMEKYTGGGYGTFAIYSAIDICNKINPNMDLIGYIREDNISSIRCFLKNGFFKTQIYKDSYIPMLKKNIRMYLYARNKGIDI